MGFADDLFWTTGARVDPDPRQDPWTFDVEEVVQVIERHRLEEIRKKEEALRRTNQELRDLDLDVIIHEYAHGVSSRLVGIRVGWMLAIPMSLALVGMGFQAINLFYIYFAGSVGLDSLISEPSFWP